jgi:DNA-binding PadR family transcriptional regulator
MVRKAGHDASGPPRGGRADIGGEIISSFWKVHILHHASEEPVVGQWMLAELRRHGYEVSPGTLYPVLKRMEARGWLRSTVDPGGGRRARREYALTRRGRSVLGRLRAFVKELGAEVGTLRRVRHGRRRPPALKS